MRIAVLVKQVPDTYGERRLNLETGLAERQAGDEVFEEITERGLEVALAYRDAHLDTEIVAITMGPAGARTTLQKALALGADSGIHVLDDQLSGADLGVTAETLAAALRRTAPDLVIAGNTSTDGGAGALPSMLAELLDLPALTNLSAVDIGDAGVSGTRANEFGATGVSAPLPALITVTEAMPEARFAGFKGVMAAKKKPVEELGVSDLGVDPAGASWGRSIVVAIAPRPAREAGVRIDDDGGAAERLVEFLVTNRLA